MEASLVGGVFNTVNQDVYEFRKKPNPLKLNYSNDDLIYGRRLEELALAFQKYFQLIPSRQCEVVYLLTQKIN